HPDDWQVHGFAIPLLSNVQPAGAYLGERFPRAGGTPAIMWELLQAGKLDGKCRTVKGRTMAEKLKGKEARDREVIRPFAEP
ncbi:dihydroxy-acid dehydratase domain-containing protein, partial [Rhizobium leguminosarum]|uniref:dihydroxy-acid dehydratase domain-containing protein n=1 Tax=Rhizobium leguminosarum TaxID=384 RepID=UPI003F9D4617